MSKKKNSKPDIEEIGDRLRQLRGGTIQREWAKLNKITASYVSQTEQGTVKPSLSYLVSVSDGAGINIHWLVTGKGPKFLLDDDGATEYENLARALFAQFSKKYPPLAESLEDLFIKRDSEAFELWGFVYQLSPMQRRALLALLSDPRTQERTKRAKGERSS